MNTSMPVEKMIEHIKAGGFAKRRHWDGARIAWHEKLGPHRGDLPLGHSMERGSWGMRYNSALACEDWTADDWIQCDKYGRAL